MKKTKSILASCLILFATVPQICASEPIQSPEIINVTDNFERLVASAKGAMMTDPEQAFTHAKQAEEFIKAVPLYEHRSEAIASTKWLQAEAMLRSGNPEEALPISQEGLGHINSRSLNQKLYADLLLAQGRIAKRLSKVDLALSSFSEAQSIFSSIDERRSEAMTLHAMAAIHREAESYDKAIEFYRLSQERYSNDSNVSLATHNSKGLLFTKMEKFGAGRVEFENAVGAAQEIESDILMARILTNWAELEVAAGEYEVAWEITNDALEVLRNTNDNYWKKFVLGVRAQVQYHRGNIKKAEGLLESAFESEDLTQTSQSFIEVHRAAYEIYKTAGKFDSALTHFESFERLDDENKRVASSATAALMSAEFEFQQQQLKIAELNAQNALDQAELTSLQRESEHKSLVMFLGSCATLALLAMLAYMRRTKRSLATANTALENTVAELNNEISVRKKVECDLRNARSESERANRAKSSFLATMSHELRTPMNGILGFSDVLLASETDMQKTKYLKIIKSSGKALLDQINDILDLSQAEAGRMNLTMGAFALREHVSRAINLLQSKASEKSLNLIVHVSPDLPAFVLGDANRVRQILINFVGNAIKFTESGTIAIELIPSEKDDQIRISVSDTGIGIPADKFDVLFERFGQVENYAERNFGGTGLGLAICQELVTMMNGSIGVNSNPGEGSQFWCEIELPRAADVDNLYIEDTVSSKLGLSAYVLEDCPVARDMIEKVFATAGIDIKTFNSLEDLLVALRDSCASDRIIDCVVVNENAITYDPREVARLITEEGLLQSGEIVLLTGELIDNRNLTELGYDKSLQLPLTLNELVKEFTSEKLLDEKGHGAGEVQDLPKAEFKGEALVVDDDVTSRLLLKTLLGSIGVEADVVSNGKDAVEAASKNAYQLIFMDKNMPIMNGAQATRRISKPGGLNCETPIISISAEDTSESDDEYEFEAQGELRKPFSLLKLNAIVSRYVERRKSIAGMSNERREMAV